MIDLDVVIPVKNTINKNNSIAITLKVLFNQKGINPNVYIVDDGSNDTTVKVLRESIFFERIHLTELHSSGVAVARNIGASKGKSEFIVFMDDDTILSQDYTLLEAYNATKDYDFSCAAYRYCKLPKKQYVLKVDKNV